MTLSTIPASHSRIQTPSTRKTLSRLLTLASCLFLFWANTTQAQTVAAYPFQFKSRPKGVFKADGTLTEPIDPARGARVRE
jgi:hypothetical protein